MKIILLTVIGALVLLWGGVLALIKWVDPIRKEHVLWLTAYTSVLSGLLIYIVIQTSIAQQEAALVKTRARLDKELEMFRERLSDLTTRLMGQIEEKAELTQSEWKVRGTLQTERSQHARTRQELAGARAGLADTRAELTRETAAHGAYLDSLNTERALHDATETRLRRAGQRQAETGRVLKATRENLARLRERLLLRESETDRLRARLERSERSLSDLKLARRELREQRHALEILQAAVDSVYLKVLQRPRN